MEPTIPFDPADYLETADDVVVFLNDALADGDPVQFKRALGVVVRSRGGTAMAQATGLSRMTLHNALAADGNPTMATLMAILGQLGVRLQVAAAARDAA